jgi:hypothetical protein
MTKNQMIVIEDDIAYNENFIKIKKEKQLSNLINNYLRTYLNVKKEVLSEDQQTIEDEIQQLNMRKVMLMEKKSEIDKKVLKNIEEQSKWKEYKGRGL